METSKPRGEFRPLDVARKLPPRVVVLDAEGRVVDTTFLKVELRRQPDGTLDAEVVRDMEFRPEGSTV